MRFDTKWLFGGLSVFLLASGAMAATITVGPGGDYSTIQAGIDAAQDGDTVEILASAPDDIYLGTGNVNLNFVSGRSITLKAATGVIPKIDGESHGVRAFNITTSQSSRIEGLHIYHCEMSGSGDDGGAVKCTAGSPTFVDCSFTGNFAKDEGGHVAVYSDADIAFEGCSFQTGYSQGQAGAIALSGSGTTATFTDCTFSSNLCDGSGGAIWMNTSSSATFTDCVFYDNQTNTATKHGGVLHSSGGSTTTTFDHCFLYANVATGAGGALSLDGSNAVLTNCVINDNVAGSQGGGLRATSGASMTVESCTIVGNVAGTDGGGIRASENATHVDVVNTILWGNKQSGGSSANQISRYNSPTVTVDHSVVEGGYTPGTNIVTVNPNLTAGNYSLLYRITYGSSAVNTGTNTPVTWSTDIDGNTRIKSTTVDIGAYEY